MTTHTSRIEKIDGNNIVLAGGKVFFVPPEKRFILEKFKAGDAVKMLEVKGTVSACFPLEADAPVNDQPRMTYSEGGAPKEEIEARAIAAGFKTGAEIKKEQGKEPAKVPVQEPAKAPTMAKPAKCAPLPQTEPKPIIDAVNKPLNASSPEIPKGGIAGIVAATKMLSKEPAPYVEQFTAGETPIEPPEEETVEYPTDAELLGMAYSSDGYWRAKFYSDLRNHDEFRVKDGWNNWLRCINAAIEHQPKRSTEDILCAAEQIHAFIESKIYDSDDPGEEPGEE